MCLGLGKYGIEFWLSKLTLDAMQAAIDQTSKLISLREGLMQTPTSVPTLANFHGDHELSAMLQQQKLSGVCVH